MGGRTKALFVAAAILKMDLLKIVALEVTEVTSRYELIIWRMWGGQQQHLLMLLFSQSSDNLFFVYY